MKFHFKRKYTASFFVLIILLAISVAFYLVGPNYINREQEFFNQILLITLVESVILTIFILGLYRVNYFLYHDHMEIHRSLRRPIHLDYSKIKEISEKKNDPVFLIFGHHPSFKVKYNYKNKTKTYRVRVEKHQLLKLVLENEKKIHITENK